MINKFKVIYINHLIYYEVGMMSGADILYNIIKSYGLDICQDSKIFKAYLNDFFTDKKSANLIMLAQEHGIISRLISDRNYLTCPPLKNQLIASLVDTYGTDEYYAKWTIDTCISSLSKHFGLNLQYKSNAKDLFNGAYIELGTYKGSPILWKCLQMLESSAFLISEYILEKSCFNSNTTNIWSSSSIRNWLNCREKHFNSNTPGFLYEFNSSDLQIITPVKKKLPFSDSQQSYNSEDDLVFLPSQEELITNLPSPSQRIKSISTACRNTKLNNNNEALWYWTRSQWHNNNYQTIIVKYGDFYLQDSTDTQGGIIPCIYITKKTFDNGFGTKDFPFFV
jgi:hypothetical protein